MSNQAQSEFWNGEAGQRWVDQSSQLDAMLLPCGSNSIGGKYSRR